MTFKSTQVTLKRSQSGELLNQRNKTFPVPALTRCRGPRGPALPWGSGGGSRGGRLLTPTNHRPAAVAPAQLGINDDAVLGSPVPTPGVRLQTALPLPVLTPSTPVLRV